jgi:hypothetical protein
MTEHNLRRAAAADLLRQIALATDHRPASFEGREIRSIMEEEGNRHGAKWGQILTDLIPGPILGVVVDAEIVRLANAAFVDTIRCVLIPGEQKI